MKCLIVVVDDAKMCGVIFKTRLLNVYDSLIVVCCRLQTTNKFYWIDYKLFKKIDTKT